jgi:hypothetical protein
MLRGSPFTEDGTVKLDWRNRFYGFLLALAGCSLMAGNICAQESPAPLATRAELRERLRDVTKALKWPSLSEKRSATEPEEFRVLVGSGTELPGVVVRTSRTPGNATGSAAFWWVRGPYSQSIRKSLEEGPSKTCKRMAKSGNVEVCDLAESKSRRDWSSVWGSRAAAEVRSLVLDPRTTAAAGSEGDTIVAAVLWFDGSRVAELFPARDTSATGSRPARAVVCLLQLLFYQAIPEAAEEPNPLEECH